MDRFNFRKGKVGLIDFALTAKNFDPKNSTVLVKHFSELEAIALAFRSNERARATIAALVLSEANLPHWQSQSTISDFSTEHHLALAMPWCTAKLKPADKELETFQHEVVQLGIESFLDDSKLFPLKALVEFYPPTAFASYEIASLVESISPLKALIDKAANGKPIKTSDWEKLVIKGNPELESRALETAIAKEAESDRQLEALLTELLPTIEAYEKPEDLAELESRTKAETGAASI